MAHNLEQRGPNTGTRAACGLWTVFVRLANAFCMPYVTQSHAYTVLATRLLQVTHHRSAGQYKTIRGSPLCDYKACICFHLFASLDSAINFFG